MCGGFTCSKNALIALNVLYVVVASILISVAVYGRASSIVTNLPIVGGILACGVFLILVSFLGLAGAVKHHQVMLFFYMVILFLLFLVQFSVACACLAVNSEQQEMLAEQGWHKVNMDVRGQVQQRFLCCSFKSRDIPVNTTADYPSCTEVDKQCCAISGGQSNCQCGLCIDILKETIDYAFKLCGGIGLFFSFTEFLGVWLTVRYRNQKDPRANPSAFLEIKTKCQLLTFNSWTFKAAFPLGAAQLSCIPLSVGYGSLNTRHGLHLSREALHQTESASNGDAALEVCDKWHGLFAVYLARRYRNQPDPDYKEPHAIFPRNNYLY